MSLTTEERERLAEFAGVIVGNGFGLEYKVDGEVISNCHIDLWTPDDIAAPQWQLQACKEAVQEAGMVEDFHRKLCQMVSPWFFEEMDEPTTHEEVVKELGQVGRECLMAEPEQKCRAILSVLEESDG